MGRTWWIGPALVIAVGLIFVGQGLGYLGSGSFMDGDIRWSWIGIALAVAGLGLGAFAWRRDRG